MVNSIAKRVLFTPVSFYVELFFIISTHDKLWPIIEFCWHLGKSASETYALIQQAYPNEDRLARATVCQWGAFFSAG